ncbi:MAG: hypothetical protein ACI87W_003582 [Halieaceae bacterium]|jgi:hypothetical protein
MRLRKHSEGRAPPDLGAHAPLYGAGWTLGVLLHKGLQAVDPDLAQLLKKALRQLQALTGRYGQMRQPVQGSEGQFQGWGATAYLCQGSTKLAIHDRCLIVIDDVHAACTTQKKPLISLTSPDDWPAFGSLSRRCDQYMC